MGCPTVSRRWQAVSGIECSIYDLNQRDFCGYGRIDLPGPEVEERAANFDETISLTSGDKYTVLSANVLSSANALLLIDDNSTPASNTAELRVVNASPVLGTVDVYIVSPGTNLSTVSPTISGLAFEAVSTYQSLTASTAYEVYFTLANQKTAQIDSGPVTYSNGEVRTMVALNGEAGGYSLAVLKDLN